MKRRWFEDDSPELVFACILILVGMFPAAWLLVGALT